MHDSACLERECRAFTRYLVQQDPTPNVVNRYVAAHAIPALNLVGPGDGTLTAIATRSATAAALADAYARLLEPRGLLRRKLVLLLAILETTPPAFQVITQPPVQSTPGALLQLAVHGVQGTLTTVASLPVVGGWKLWHRVAGR